MSDLADQPLSGDNDQLGIGAIGVEARRVVLRDREAIGKIADCALSLITVAAGPTTTCSRDSDRERDLQVEEQAAIVRRVRVRAQSARAGLSARLLLWMYNHVTI